MDIALRTVKANGIEIRLAEAGPETGPPVLLCHGFPESWYSWRHQLQALGEAGYRVIAPDMRGYGGTDKPHDIDQYSIFHLVGDMVGLLDALQVMQAVVIGHDWGAPVAWHCALFRPDRFRAVGGLSVPFYPRAKARPTSVMPATDEGVFYQTYFQAPGIAEAELERDVRASVRAFQLMWSQSTGPARKLVPRDGGVLTGAPGAATPLPAWVSEADIDFYAGEFARGGFRGPLNWYRNIDRNWELTAPWQGARIAQPALYMIGENDPVRLFKGMDRLIPNLESLLPGLREKHVVPDCGHWIQREKAALVNGVMLRFLAGLG